MSENETLMYLKSLEKFGMRSGLERIETLLASLSNPQLEMDFIHVGGTNGKGSVSIMLESVLRESGYITGIFTSPHLNRYTERIKVCGEEIPVEAVEEITKRLEPVAKAMADDPNLGHPTEFEMCTAICLEWFKRQKVKIAVMEVGLGGLLDSTNVINPKVSVITSIGLDHVEVLGRDLREIALQKAGIIKNGIPVIISEQLPEADNVLCEVALDKKSPIYYVGDDITYEVEKADLSGTRVLLHMNDKENLYHKKRDFHIDLKLLGEYQAQNAACALGVINVLREYPGYEGISDEDIIRGLSKAEHPGRMEIVKGDPLIILDGAHNLDGATALSKSLFGMLSGEKVVMLLALSKDKPAKEMLLALKENISYLIVTMSKSSRMGNFSSDELLKLAIEEGIPTQKIDELNEAFNVAKLKASGKKLVVCGSLYLIGEIKSILSKDTNL